MKKTILFSGFAAVAFFAAHTVAPAHAATSEYKFSLSGDKETPPNQTKGSGEGTATFDDVTHIFKYKVEFKDLTGPATAAHFHGPAKVGVPAGVTVPVKSPAPLTSPISGQALITAKQAKDLDAGLWYFNVHTAGNPKGEIRGQVEKLGAMGRAAESVKDTMGMGTKP